MARFAGGGVIEDVGGSFARFLKQAPKVVKHHVIDAVELTAFSLGKRMEQDAPVGPDAPHIKDFVTWKRRGMTAQVGYLDATEAAGPGNTATIAGVALMNEYAPNKQPFMRPAAERESPIFVKRMKNAIKDIEAALGGK
jgi:hypothetical protein